MRKKRKYTVITFHTTSAAMAMEKYCMQQGIPGRLIPVPRELSAGCGLAWRIPVEDYELSRERFLKANLEHEQVAEVML